ncbi:putative amino-acid permease C15C4.04c [Pseudocercospora fuligena]|uniref:Putative amino-acid permease C15C4.04c n=1 Tax=Pseudocercospora fuligena TaxID=685502 RepID=A0A8H6RLP9_9PEZI|nr:putative amino-acid permease C15C4.04c [Pseudocercospora fuligena]
MVGTVIQGLIALDNPDYVYHRWHGTLLTIAIVVLSVLYNVVLCKRLPVLAQFLFVAHVLGLFATVIPLWITAPKGKASSVLLKVEDNGGWGNTGLSAMIGLLPIVGVLNGYDCIAHMSEEINDASKVLPIAMAFSVSLNIMLCLIMGTTLIFCLGDLDSAMNSTTGQPFIQIYYNATQSRAGTSAMVAIAIMLITSSGVNELATSSRQLWAFARDGGLPCSRWLSHVSPGLNIPLRAICVSFTVSCLLALINIGSSVALNAINSLGGVAVLFSYMVTISCLVWRRTCGAALPPRRWTLGKYGLAVNVAALIFLAPIIFFYFWPLAQPVTPSNLNWSSLIFSGLLLIAALYYFVKARHEYVGPVVQVKRE